MRNPLATLALLALPVAACHRATPPEAVPVRDAGVAVAARDTTRPDYFAAVGTADPIEESVLSTRLMATVLAVNAVEGARVAQGELLVRLDATELDASRRRASAAMDDATTARDLAHLTADRMRRMYADSAAPRAQLDGAETAAARADAQLAAAREAINEVDATARYAEIRAPFAGVLTRRQVDPGALAAPGAPLVTVAATDRLRITVSVPADFAAAIRSAAHLLARIAGRSADAIVEGVVPSGGNLYTINALVDNRAGTFLVGSAATLLVPRGSRHVILVPSAALVHQGDLVGVRRRFAAGDELTWITVGAIVGDQVEVLSGLAAGDSVVVPRAMGGTR